MPVALRSEGLQRPLGTVEEGSGGAGSGGAGSGGTSGAPAHGRLPAPESDRHRTLRRTASSGRIESHTHG